MVGCNEALKQPPPPPPYRRWVKEIKVDGIDIAIFAREQATLVRPILLIVFLSVTLLVGVASLLPRIKISPGESY
jgi:hypothetical protein